MRWTSFHSTAAGGIIRDNEMLSKKTFITLGIIIPLAAHVATTFRYAYGGYDGKHCAGLLDAVWECSEFEYYLDWLFNPFTIISLLGYFFISALLTTLAWHGYKNYHKQN